MPCIFQRKDADLVARETDWEGGESAAAAAGLIQNFEYLCLSFPILWSASISISIEFEEFSMFMSEKCI